MNSKICLKCNGVFSIKDFSIDRSKKDGRSIYCGLCVRRFNKIQKSKPDYKTKRKATRTDQEANRIWRLKTRYGITLEQFDIMLKSQDNGCAICKVKSNNGKSFVVDHCHKTGIIRGLLCTFCNKALGMFKDDPSYLEKAIKYLKEFS